MKFTIRRDDRCMCGKPVPAGSQVEYDRDKRPAIRECPSCNSALSSASALAQATPNAPVDYVSKLEVVVVRETWRKPDGSKAIVKCEVRGGLGKNDPSIGASAIGVIGRWPLRPEPNSVWEVHGTWKHDPKYGWSLQASVILPSMGNTDEDLITYLRSNIPHFGGARAKALLELC